MNKSQMVLMMAACVMLLILPTITGSDVVEELDLAYYPTPFISNERLDTIFVVGEFADSGDVLALVEVATKLQDEVQEIIFESTGEEDANVFEIDIKGNPQDELTELYMDVLNKKRTEAAKTILDTSLHIEDIADQNVILVGGPCVNWLSAHFMGNPKNCVEGFTPGKAQLQLFRNGRGTVLMVAGYSVDDTRMAANIIANYKDFSANLVGEKVSVSSAWINQIKIS